MIPAGSEYWCEKAPGAFWHTRVEHQHGTLYYGR
jgi:hypothetical protein